MSSDVGWHIRDKLWPVAKHGPCCFTSTKIVRLIRSESPGRPPRLSHSSWTLGFKQGSMVPLILYHSLSRPTSKAPPLLFFFFQHPLVTGDSDCGEVAQPFKRNAALIKSEVSKRWKRVIFSPLIFQPATWAEKRERRSRHTSAVTNCPQSDTCNEYWRPLAEMITLKGDNSVDQFVVADTEHHCLLLSRLGCFGDAKNWWGDFQIFFFFSFFLFFF